ncbi:conserved hypothetical protein [Nitrospina gracilis 3/211]|uniref:DUF374 domain-containing protein n=1 Tax=Nitrospina gracilis (strain 3/211) TaxID=1266370 RepID=M1YGH2_NITG3|nr:MULTISPECIES: lysophospholipid acyltransferase family protein [Nitrospina]MCF8722627.1 lysophospholipid acyltransferase (LPLAT)-like uncharacterized protein [Nitrospina sp. Nb-3]CCQ89556.1 conserved hypothetical protein [Nitrospina gracilis 3/211]
MKKFLFNQILPPLIFFLVHLWFKTLRIEIMNPEIEREVFRQGRPHVLTCWHQHLGMFFYHFRGWKELTILISPSTDGDLAARMCKWMGYHVVRGSSYKQPTASTRTLIRALKKNLTVGIMADGSRGPRHVAQMGTLYLSRLTGTPYSACSWDARWKIQFKSWDRFMLPLPFSRCRIAYSPFRDLPRKADNALLETHRGELEAELKRLAQEVSFR